MKIQIALLLGFTLSLTCHGQVEDIRILESRLPAIGDSVQYVDVLNRIAFLQYEQSPDSTAYYAHKAREIAVRIGDARGIADAINNMGVMADVEGDEQTALRYYSDAYNRYTALKDSSNVVQTLMNIAMVYTDEGKSEKAIEHYQLASDIGNRLSRDSILSLVLYNYLLQFPDRFSPGAASATIEKAVAIAAKYHDTRTLLAIEQLKADKLIAAGQRDSGLAVLQHAATEARAKDLYYLSLDILVELGDLFTGKDDARAVDYYKQVLAIAEARHYETYERDITQKLFDFYSARKDTAQALYYSQKLVQALIDKQDNEKKGGIDFIDYALKDQQLTTAQEESALSSKLLWLACLACGLAVAIIVLLRVNGKRKRRTHLLLQKQYANLEAVSESLEKRNQQYARLLKIVAHDLRNPIGAIQSASVMMLKSEKKEAALVNMVHEASSRCLQLIGELLETDFEVKPEMLHPEPVVVADLLQSAAEPMNFRTGEKNQLLVVADDLRTLVRIDKEQIRRVLENLVGNAMKFSPAGSVITVAAREDEDHVILSVKDEGIGIPSSIEKQVFDPFTSAKRKGTAGEQTYGLGLFICKQIVEAHGGSIWFESEENKGSTFFIQLKKYVPVPANS